MDHHPETWSTDEVVAFWEDQPAKGDRQVSDLEPLLDFVRSSGLNGRRMIRLLDEPLLRLVYSLEGWSNVIAIHMRLVALREEWDKKMLLIGNISYIRPQPKANDLSSEEVQELWSAFTARVDTDGTTPTLNMEPFVDFITTHNVNGKEMLSSINMSLLNAVYDNTLANWNSIFAIMEHINHLIRASVEVDQSRVQTPATTKDRASTGLNSSQSSKIDSSLRGKKRTLSDADIHTPEQAIEAKTPAAPSRHAFADYKRRKHYDSPSSSPCTRLAK